ncbi:MAG: prephenate dehydrogenase/arogenate dehydrogenase family protein [Eubacterium sp.]|nr:prephenate dehydrogenase/arogenate dehydrogenase family protein [Eubacterium sp.]
MKQLTIGFLGLGLIGGSIARSIRKNFPSCRIIVYSRRKNEDLLQGIKDGIISDITYAIDAHFSECDIIFLCAPVLQNIQFLEQLKPLINKTCIITDVGSVKGNIHKEVERLELESQFIGGHPMAGSEKTGFANSSEDLLQNSFYLLTPCKTTAEEKVLFLKKILSGTGAIFATVDAGLHDDITAAISHVPHIVAASLVNMVRENDTSNELMKTFAAGGFKDITRIASSSPEMWESICLSNADSIDHFLSLMIDELTKMRSYIANEQGTEINRFFASSREYRDSIH